MEANVYTPILNKIISIEADRAPLHQKIRSLFTLLDLYMEELLKDERIHFTTLFTKLSYLCLKYKISRKLVYFSHLHRKNLELLDENNANEEKYVIAKYVLIGLITEIEHCSLPSNLKKLWIQPKYEASKRTNTTEKLNFARVNIFEYIENEHILIGFNEAIPDEEVRIKMNVLGKNDDYNSLLRFISRRKKFPFTVHLEHVEVMENGIYIPQRIIYEPDYLIDITTISECFKPNESNPLFYFIKKFFPVFQNKYLIIGNTANYFLDEIFNDPEVEFETLLKNTFKLSPLGFSVMTDAEISEVVRTLKAHFHTIKEVVNNQFNIHSINQENSFLEPSFYAPKYGIQGRLDLYSAHPSSNEAKIIELKSGKPFKANSYGLNINHYVQTLLYDLTVRSSSNSKLKISSFILYSSQTDNPLRFAPPLKIQQKEAIKLRNQLVEIDYLLADVDVENKSIFSYIHGDYINSAGFAKRDIDAFQKTYSGASELARKYFNSFTAFIAREQILAKTGEFGLDKSSGLAGLWLDDMQEKIENFRVLNALKILDIRVEKESTNIIFERTPSTSSNANFRVGDLGVLYPYNNGNLSVVKNQIFKCSIISLSQSSVELRLRNKQNNKSIFDPALDWHIEHDHLDHGFNYMYQDLYRFLNASKDHQELILGRKSPLKPIQENEDIEIPESLTGEQGRILKDMISSKQYYLLWGPPGTGKTSVMLHEYLKHSYNKTNENILVLAYTNKAVDEICEAVLRIKNNIEKHFLRIGSRYSTNSKFSKNLLVTKLEDIDNRKDLLELLKSTRIVVSTLASIHGKKDLFGMMKFDSIIVDEASQILEPHLCGLLSFAEKFILIGDHNQLPAIVLQREDESEVNDEQLKAIGLSDRRNSLFERLYKRGVERKWEGTTGKLTMQGRMHEDLMLFANKHFYKGMLDIIPNIPRLAKSTSFFHSKNSITTYRLNYIPCHIDDKSINFKTNQDEATKVAKLVKNILHIYKEEQKPISAFSIGVITPYRAQISAIKSELHKLDINNEISVDTVERYQGSARDIVILSMCLNIESQLNQLVNLSADNIDRKLNVALTRAKEQIYILGNKSIMEKNEVYKDLMMCSNELHINNE